MSMPTDLSAVLVRWGVAVDAFNRGDCEPLGELLADRCEFTASAGRVGGTRDEILAAVRQGRATGWESHNPLAHVVSGEFLLEAFRNDYGDGTSFLGAAVMRVGDDGRITEIRTLDATGAVEAMRARAGQVTDAPAAELPGLFVDEEAGPEGDLGLLPSVWEEGDEVAPA
jgi:hypothetical protein